MATPIWKQAGFSSQAAYEAELARKRAAGIALTRPDLAAEYDRQRQGNLLTGAQLLAINQQSAGGAAKAPVTAQAPVTVQPPYQSPVDTYKPGTFKAPSYTPLSFNAALGQAQSQLAPLYDQARTQQGITAEQQRALLRQQMGARGQLRGGLINEANIDLSSGLLRSLADIDTGYQAQTAGLAQSLVAQDQARADAMRQQAYQEWLAGEQLRAQAAGLSAEEYWRNVAQQNWERDFTAGQDWQQRQFDYQVSRDQVMDERWLKQFSAQEQQAIENAYQNRQISLQERNALLSRSGSGGGTLRPAISLSKYLAAVQEMLKTSNPSEIIAYLSKQDLASAEIAEILKMAGISLTGAFPGIHVKTR
ncbi:MAG: hypothetical protein ACOX8W_02920 [bacterium]|jgi:lambda repressor-like predicted transcriptional regulator